MATNKKVKSGEAFEENYSFEWKIQNFLAIKSCSELLREQQLNFIAGDSHGCPTKWCCYLKASSSTFQVILWLKECPDNCTVVVNHMFQMIKPDGTASGTNSAECEPFTEGSKRVGINVPVERNGVVLRELIWEDGSIVVKMNIKLLIFKPCANEDETGPLNYLVDVEEEVLRFEYRELQNLRDLTTKILGESGREPEVGKIIKVVSKDGVKFYANSAILSARSPVFKAILKGGKWKAGQGSTGGGGGGSLVLEDLSEKTVTVLLNYLIRGALKEEWKAEDVILELTWAAQKYQLERMTEFLDKVLPGINFIGMEVVAKLALLTKRLEMKNAEKGLFIKLKETATDIDELLLDKRGTLLGKGLKERKKGCRFFCWP